MTQTSCLAMAGMHVVHDFVGRQSATARTNVWVRVDHVPQLALAAGQGAVNDPRLRLQNSSWCA